MRASETQPAYVLHARAYRETSLLLELFTLQQGRVGALARGVRGARAQPLRAALQPLQPVLISLSGRGELAILASAEMQGRAVSLSGDALLAAFYVNELLVRLLPRHDAMPDLFVRYAACLGQLADDNAVAWTLRRFERDLLEALGFGLRLDSEADSEHPLRADACYRYSAEHGAIAVRSSGSGAVPGAALIALAADQQPDAALLPPLRNLLRGQIRDLLGGRELQSWSVLAGLPGKAAMPPPSGALGSAADLTAGAPPDG